MITKKIYVLILFCSVLLSCKKDIINEQKINKINNKQKFIEDNFLKIADTVAYSRGAFITTPSDSISYPKLSVKLSRKINYIKGLEELTNAYFLKNKNLGIIFKDVINKKSYSIITLDSNFPKSIGKYYFFFNDNQQDKSIKYAGRIDIENFKIYKNKAVLLLTKSVGRYGTTFIVLLIKENGNWKVYKRDVLLMS
ncbi:hypothetical protein [Flavobacterium sp. TAB 87]|uniref:hypothetical protein n=1 Tax=Flavobacterium sp. TAB 87 TaxID=1729581 RepID=UPI00076C7ABF|nr:hypothetical protein [Flavobacterium sp. TAB 87]KVV15064.1 hypothetical protein AP058_01622 [Flavobacterium sp. TAB 87]